MVTALERLVHLRSRRPIAPGDQAFARRLRARFLAPPPTGRPSDWITSGNIVFAEPEVSGPFNLTGRHYLEQLLNDNYRPNVAEQDVVFGTGCGKTISFMAGLAWQLKFVKPRGLYVMPTQRGPAGVINFVNSRFKKMLEASPAFKTLLPTGAQRHQITGQHVSISGAVIDFAGANSAGQLSANRCSVVYLDELDKYKRKLGNEAGAAYLAKTRTDGVIGAKIFRSSSPSIETGGIWESMLTGNLNRRFLPCPHCNSAVNGVRSPRPLGGEGQGEGELRERTLAILKKYHCESQLPAALQWLQN